MEEISFRLSARDDEQSVLGLFKSAFGKEKRSDEWRWEYLGCPGGSIVVLALTNDSVVGHYGVLPKNLRWLGSVSRAGLVVDVMTDPNFGRRGIFVQSAQYAFKRCDEEGISLLVGFPNDAAIRGHQKVGWSELGGIRILARPLKAESFLRRVVRNEEFAHRLSGFVDAILRAGVVAGRIYRNDRWKISTVTVSDLLGHANELNALVNASIPLDTIATERDPQWLSWKLADPLGRYMILEARDRDTLRLEGVAVLKIKEVEGFKMGEIVELLVRPKHRRLERALLIESVNWAYSEDCDLCVVLNNPAARRLPSCLLAMLPPIHIRLRFIVRSTRGDSLPPTLLDLNNWYLDLIDHDVF